MRRQEVNIDYTVKCKCIAVEAEGEVRLCEAGGPGVNSVILRLLAPVS